MTTYATISKIKKNHHKSYSYARANQRKKKKASQIMSAILIDHLPIIKHIISSCMVSLSRWLGPHRIACMHVCMHVRMHACFALFVFVFDIKRLYANQNIYQDCYIINLQAHHKQDNLVVLVLMDQPTNHNQKNVASHSSGWHHFTYPNG